jgi:ATP-dependent Clp protease ATP-binding subunit ClpX
VKSTARSGTIEQLEPEDLIVRPHSVGRLPVTARCTSLTSRCYPDHAAAQRHHAAVSAPFEYENVKLRHRRRSSRRSRRPPCKIGARGLRMIIEDIMLDLVHAPGQKKIRECVITREVVESKEKPITVIEKVG